MTCGIYCFTLRGTSRCYVGSSLDIEERRSRHITDARAGKMGRFHCAIREFGETAFDFEILGEYNRDELLEQEARFIRAKQAAGIEGFNVHTVPARNFIAGHSESSRARISAAMKGRPKSAETRRRMSEAQKLACKIPRSRETIEKMRMTLTGKKHSPETKLKMSQSRRAFLKANPEEIARLGAIARQRVKKTSVLAQRADT